MLISIEQQQEQQDKYIKLLQETDKETAHIQANIIICDLLEELGYSEVVSEYNKIDKLYS